MLEGVDLEKDVPSMKKPRKKKKCHQVHKKYNLQFNIKPANKDQRHIKPLLEKYRQIQNQREMSFVPMAPKKPMKESEKWRAFSSLLLRHDSYADSILDESIKSIKQCGMATHIPASGLPFVHISDSDIIKSQMDGVMSNLSTSSIGN